MILKLTKRPDLTNYPKTNAAFLQFEHLINEISKKSLDLSGENYINSVILKINQNTFQGELFQKTILRQQSVITKFLEKKYKIVPIHYYRNLWMALGLPVFGIPLGLIYGLAIKNMGFMGIGLPIGLAIGIGLGSFLDKKAKKENRQLQIELKQM